MELKIKKEVGCRRIEISNLHETNPFTTCVTDEMINDFDGNYYLY